MADAAEKGLRRERNPVLPRRSRDDHEDDRTDSRARHVDTREETDDPLPRRQRRRRRRGPDGRPPLSDELTDLNRGGVFVLAESVALGMNIFSRVLRRAVDRAFDEDYNEPGDVVRGVTEEADQVAYDLVDELRRVPRRLDQRFDEAIRSPRAERGERARRRND